MVVCLKMEIWGYGGKKTTVKKYAKIGLWWGGEGVNFLYWRANLPRHHVFQGKKIFYCGLVMCLIVLTFHPSLILCFLPIVPWRWNCGSSDGLFFFFTPLTTPPLKSRPQ